MAKITNEAIKKINDKCANNWKFDVNYYFFHSEKTLTKTIKLDDEHFLKCQLYFSEECKMFRRVGWNITLHISKFTGLDGVFATSSGLGLFRDIAYPKDRRSYADLEKLTAIIDDSYIMEIYNNPENQHRLDDGILLDEKGWHLHKV